MSSRQNSTSSRSAASKVASSSTRATPRSKPTTQRGVSTTNAKTNSKAGSATGSTVHSGTSSAVLLSRVGFLVTVACLLVFGLIMLYSASSVYSYNQSGDYTAVFFKQTIFVAVGAVLALIIALIPYQTFSFKLCAAALAICIPLLIIVMAEDAALGARRWIDFGFTTLQPSEFAKIAMMLVLAHLVERCRNEGYSKALIGLMIFACIVPLGLIIIEPDLGTTIIAVIGILAVLWFGGVPKRIVAALTLGMVLLAVLAIVGTGFRQTRITSWLEPESDPLGSGYQLLNSYYAFGGGGIFGVGLGLSKQKFNWLPQSENDFLFAIIGEELGLVGALLVMVLFMALVVMALKIAANAPNALGAMIAGGSGVIIGAQAFLNMLCVVGALPTTGKPLPFFSAGGSSVISTMILVGLILSVSLQSSGSTIYDFRREQFSVVTGGNKRGSASGGRGSVLSRLPNPAALVSGLRVGAGAKGSQGSGAQRKQGAQGAQRSAGGRAQRMQGAKEGHTTQSTQRALQPVRSERRPQSSVQSDQRPRQASYLPRTSQVPKSRPAQDKVVPISRGRAERITRERQASSRRQELHQGASSEGQTRRQAKAPVSLSSLRRHHVPKTGSGGKSA